MYMNFDCMASIQYTYPWRVFRKKIRSISKSVSESVQIENQFEALIQINLNQVLSSAEL